jgi:hypothetical protein
MKPYLYAGAEGLSSTPKLLHALQSGHLSASRCSVALKIVVRSFDTVEDGTCALCVFQKTSGSFPRFPSSTPHLIV